MNVSNTLDPFPVFPNGPYVSKFFIAPASSSGLDHLDIDLYNFCYLPSNPLPYNTKKIKIKRSIFERSSIVVEVQQPSYDTDEPPCRRQAAINSNCYFTWNGTLESIDIRKDAIEQQECFCDVYPFFDAVDGCQACFEEHGGIEGYHWFPSSYISAASATYCSATSLAAAFYPFVSQWAATATAGVASVPSTTAQDLLGTATAASLYYTAPASSTAKSSLSSSNTKLGTKQKAGLVVAFLLAVNLVM